MKEKKGLFSKLFSKKPNQGGCCNIQFEEISDENEILRNQMDENCLNIEDKADSKKQNKAQ